MTDQSNEVRPEASTPKHPLEDRVQPDPASGIVSTYDPLNDGWWTNGDPVPAFVSRTDSTVIVGTYDPVNGGTYDSSNDGLWTNGAVIPVFTARPIGQDPPR